MKIVVDQEFKDIIPPLSAEEYKALEESILEEGVRDPIHIWNGIIIDGHNRFEIAEKNGITCPTRTAFFFSRDEAIVWIIDNQRGRRNLSKEELLKLGFKRAELLRPKAEENKGKRTDLFQESEKGSFEPVNTTAEAAKYAGVSIDTASKYKKVMAEAPEEIKKEVSTGKKSINKAYQEIRKPEYEEELEEGVVYSLEDTIQSVRADMEKEAVKEKERGKRIAALIIEKAESLFNKVSPVVKDTAIEELKQWINGIEGEKDVV